ncbi:uncharacterized protein LOC128956905 [Oppia nitens]|uniref:uncharacterized protein LOC128956905 n=1 Tax=Oppia nitens TaxID=1686743 RepID=UPI0023DADFED|nr:uncharacterized protein LOC128956905 [Oppia nitens]
MNDINYMRYDRDAATKWELGVHIPGLALQFVGLYGSYREHEQAIGSYGLLMILFACLSIGTNVWSDFIVNWLLTVLYVLCSCTALTFAYEMRRLRLNAAIAAQLWQTTAGGGVGVIPVHTANNFVYTTPATMGNTVIIGSGQHQQSAVILPTTTTTQYGNQGGVIQMISPVSMIQPTSGTTMMANTSTVYHHQPGATGGGHVYPLNPGASRGQYAEQPPSYQQSETNKHY